MSRISSEKNGSNSKKYAARSSGSVRSFARAKTPPHEVPKLIQNKHICSCDASRNQENVSASNQCLCEEVDYQKELTMFFYDSIMQNVFIKRYSTGTLDTFSDDNISSLMLLKYITGQVSDLKYNQKDTKADGNPLTSKKSSHRSRKNPKREKQIKTTNALLQDITEVKSSMEKFMGMTTLDDDWYVKRDEKYAKIVFKNGNVYEGDVADKVPHGNGTFWWTDGTIYEGQFQNGAIIGSGKMQLPDLTKYEGTFYNGYFHGRGVYNMRATNMVYEGGWKYGNKHGSGWLLYEPGVWYQGEFDNGFRNGRGYFQFSDGSCYEGSYVRNKRNGHGAMRWINNDIYIGQWLNGIINGFGEYSWKVVRTNTLAFPVQHYYKGYWVKGRRTGTGVMLFGNENGAKMAGIFQDNFKHGAAVVVCGNGRSVERNPLFLNDKPIHISFSGEDLIKQKSSTTLSQQQVQEIVTTEMANEQWPLKTFPAGVTRQLLDSVRKEEGILCNPIEIQIHSSPDDIELSFYIEKALTMYAHAFDTIQFGSQSADTSSSSKSTKNQSKWNLITISTYGPSKDGRCSDHQEATAAVGRMSISQGGTNINKKNSTYESTMRNEAKYLKNMITRYLPKLMEIYYHYATIALPKMVYYKHYMIRMFLWQMYLDIGITQLGIPLVEIDNILDENPASFVESCHHPFEHIYFFQFVQSLMGTALLIHYNSLEQNYSTEGLMPYIFKKFLVERLFVHFGSHIGRSLFEFKDFLPIKNVYDLYLKLGEPLEAKTFLNTVCTKNGEDPPCYKAWHGNGKSSKSTQNQLGHNIISVGHNFLYIPETCAIGELPEEPLEEFEERDPFYQDLSTFRILGPKLIVQCLYTVCPPIVQSGVICNMEYEMTFLEFYEVLICCALLTVGNHKKIKELMKTSLAEDAKFDNSVDVDTSNRGSAKIRKRK